MLDYAWLEKNAGKEYTQLARRISDVVKENISQENCRSPSLNYLDSYYSFGRNYLIKRGRIERNLAELSSPQLMLVETHSPYSHFKNNKFLVHLRKKYQVDNSDNFQDIQIGFNGFMKDFYGFVKEQPNMFPRSKIVYNVFPERVFRSKFVPSVENTFNDESFLNVPFCRVKKVIGLDSSFSSPCNQVINYLRKKRDMIKLSDAIKIENLFDLTEHRFD
jgi:hypothetical protein